MAQRKQKNSTQPRFPDGSFFKDVPLFDLSESSDSKGDSEE